MLTRILFFLLFPLTGICQSTGYKNLALEGCGTQAVAYAGAFHVLEEKNILQPIEKVAGSSSGAIAGLLLCVGYNAKEIDSIMRSLPFQRFNDGGGGLYGKYRRAKKKFGIFKGDYFHRWLRELLQSKTGNADLSFEELHALKLKDPHYKDLYCTGTNLSRQRLEIFSFETTPKFSLATAVRISGGIPLYFIPVALDDSLRRIKKGDRKSYINYYVDGSMLCNYPISLFDTCTGGGQPLLSPSLLFNQQTLGLKMERKEQIDSFMRNSISIPPYHPQTARNYAEAFANLMIETMERKYPGLKNETGRTIYINSGDVDPRIRRMKPATREILYQNGVAGAENFFKMEN